MKCRIIVRQNGVTNFNFDEHIHVTPRNPLFWATIVVHEVSNSYFPIITLLIFMWHEVEKNFCAEMAWGWMFCLDSTDLCYMMGFNTSINVTIADAGDGWPEFWPCKFCDNLKNFVNVEQIWYHLITRGMWDTTWYGVSMGRLVRLFCKKPQGC